MSNALGRMSLLVGCLLLACIPMKTLRGSTATFLTPAGARVTVNRPAAMVVPVVQQVFAERGFSAFNQATPTPASTVLFMRGTRAAITSQNGSADAVYGLDGQIGSWFAVRVTEENGKSIVTFYGKPTVYRTEVCADQDDQLRDTGYACIEVRVRAEWPATQLVEGREETEVITAVIATLTERLPEH